MEINIKVVFLSFELLEQRCANFFCKEPNRKYFRLGAIQFLNIHVCHCNSKATIDNM